MNVPIDISPSDLEIVREILAEYVPEHEVLAFGSRVTWTARQYSDIDLALITVEPLDTTRIADLREAFVESDLAFQVDIVDWASTSESFRQIIEKECLTIQGKSVKKKNLIEWRLRRISSLGQIVTGKTPSTKEPSNFGGPYPFITIPDLHKQVIIRKTARTLSEKGAAKMQSSLLPPGTVVMSCIATVGKCGIVSKPSFTNQQINGVIPNAETNSRFLYYVFTQLGNTMNSVGGGGSIYTNVSKTRFSNIEIQLPPPPEQQAIAHILGSLDDKIELNRRMNETLEEMARALFKSWFVDFDPVRAKIEGRWRHGESLPGLPADLWDIFPKKLINSRLGKIPEGWKVKTLGNLCYKPQYGYNASAKSEPIGPKFLRITDINKKAWIDWEQVPYCKITEEEFDKYCLHKGDLLIARMADPGHGVMIEEEEEAVFASYLIRFRPIHEFQTRFLQYWFRSDKYWDLVLGRSAGTTRVSLNARALSEFPLVVPSRSVSEAFEKHINSLRIRVVTNASESSILANIRDKLLPKLLSGKLNFSVLF